MYMLVNVENEQMKRWKLEHSRSQYVRLFLPVHHSPALRKHKYAMAAHSHSPCILAAPRPCQVEDELLLVRAALQRIARLCADMGFDEIIQNSAMTYMTRFYVHTSALDVLPQDLLYVSLVYPSL